MYVAGVLILFAWFSECVGEKNNDFIPSFCTFDDGIIINRRAVIGTRESKNRRPNDL